MSIPRALITSAVIVAAGVILGGTAVHQRYSIVALADTHRYVIRVDTWTGRVVTCTIDNKGLGVCP